MQEFKNAYLILDKIINNKSYSNIELNKLDTKANNDLIYKIVLGVLDKKVSLDYVLKYYVDKKLDEKAYILALIGIYSIDYLNSIPNYATVSNIVDLAKDQNLSYVKNYLNWLLRAYIRKERTIKFNNSFEKLSFITNKPEWILKELARKYSINEILDIFKDRDVSYEEIRVNKRKMTEEEFLAELDKKKIKYIKEKNSYTVKAKSNLCLSTLFKCGKITYQGESSCVAVNAMDLKDHQQILDLCAAPGGKSVYISEFFDNLNIISCDVHQHRVELINSYVKRMDAINIKTMQLNGLEYKKEFENKFDRILVDAPCSGLGVVAKKPDIILNLSLSDIYSLQKVQLKLLKNAISYLKEGGKLVYSTCSILDLENDSVINSIINEFNDVIEIDKNSDGQECRKTILPSDKNRDGFYIARIVKKNK